MISLKAQGWEIEIAPKHGASILRCAYEGHDVLHPATMNWVNNPAPFEASCFPLVPFSNRIENGQFEFEGRKVKLPRNHPDEAHVLHGIGWTSHWDVISESADHCVLMLQHTGGDWPWPFEVVYRFDISGPDFIQSLKVTNMGDFPMPAGLGFHPYFPERETARIMFKASGIWDGDAEVLPVSWNPLDSTFNFEAPTALRTLNYDNCFTGWRGNAQIEWADRSYHINISGNPELDHAVFYTSKDQPCFCFEPVSHGNNALVNKEVMAKGKPMRLDAGDVKYAEMRISIRV